MTALLKICILSLTVTTLVACSDSSDDSKKEGGKVYQDSVNWNSIPAEYSPREERIDIELRGTEKIQLDLFGFQKDVRLQYSKDMPQNNMSLQLFTVRKDAKTYLGGANTAYNDSTLRIYNQGSYQCNMSITNRKITGLEGACYVRAIVTLPAGAEIEVYNVGQLLSRRFFAMSVQDLFKGLDEAWSSKEKKMAVIASFLESYRIVGKKTQMTANDLGRVTEHFSFAEEKFEVLKKLHTTVYDRENLHQMIEDKFNYFDRERARQIVGLQ